MKIKLAPHLVVAASSWASRIISGVVQLISVRLLLSALGVEQYAIFALLTGLQGWFLLADFGVGVSAQNHISEARAKKEEETKYEQGGLILCVGLMLLTLFLHYLTSPILGPIILKSFQNFGEAEKSRLYFISGAMLICFNIYSIVYKLWYAHQRGYMANVLPAVASLIALALLYLADTIDVGRRLEYCLTVFLLPPLILPAAVFFWKLINNLDFKKLKTSVFKEIIKRAFGFWAFAIVAACTLQIDIIVLSQIMGAEEIAVYTVLSKIFGLAFFIYNAVLLALWPVFSELATSKRWNEVKVYLKKYILAGIVYMAIATISILIAAPLLTAVIAPGQTLRLSAGLILAMGAYQMIRVWTDTYAMLMQSMSQLRVFWIFVPIQAALSVGLQFAFADVLGLYGLVLGLSLSFLLTVSWALPHSAAKIFKS